ncbi:MAG: hypothetical protein ACON4O_07535 [Lentimonas sp.]
MDLSDSQKSSVAAWITEGKSLAQVQALLREEFSISMTYMDVRFLVDDLDIAFKETEEPEEFEDGGTEGGAEAAEAEVVDEGSVTVEVDALMRPGSLVSGSVIFSDGKTLNWQLSSTGQLGLIPGDDPEYRPSPEDVQSFQEQLQEVLQQKGY